MQRILLFCSFILLAVGAFAQDCETFSAQLDEIKRSVQNEPEQKLADVDFLYTLDKRLLTEAEVRELCKEGIEIEKIVYRRIEGQKGAQPLIRLVRNAAEGTNKEQPTFLLKWTFANKKSVPEGLYDHDMFHQEMEENGQPVFIFRIGTDLKLAEEELDPDKIEAINVWKDEAHLAKYDAKDSAGIVEIMLKEDQNYIDFLGIDK